jgi:hypothetical protein
MLPPGQTVVGLDEHTGLIFDFEKSECTVSGVSSVSLVRECDPEIYASGKIFPLSELGDIKFPSPMENGISSEAWDMLKNASSVNEEVKPDNEVLSLMQVRQAARASKNWAESDRIRDEIASRGWLVKDTPEGPVLMHM